MEHRIRYSLNTSPKQHITIDQSITINPNHVDRTANTEQRIRQSKLFISLRFKTHFSKQVTNRIAKLESMAV
jgi:hypothetical protein